MGKLLITDLLLKGKKVLIRVDFNVPLSDDGSIADDTRIRASIPTIEYALHSGAAVILMSHLSTPKEREKMQPSLGICAKQLSKLISAPVLFVTDCVGKEVEKKVKNLKGGEVLLLENLRYYLGEEVPEADPNFVKKLSQLGDFYVNDAFSAAHRPHASITAICQYFPQKAAMGLLMEKEIVFLNSLLESPAHPFFILMGGGKISQKLNTLKKLIQKADALFLGGKMALIFFKIQGIDVGDSNFLEEDLKRARELVDLCERKGFSLSLPLDMVIADRFDKDATFKVISLDQGIPKGWIGMDIGPATIQAWKEAFLSAATLFWNGPLGVFEFPSFSVGTREIIKELAALKAKVIIGGGESLLAIHTLLAAESQFAYLSMGGGALLEYLEKRTLPGIEALTEV